MGIYFLVDFLKITVLLNQKLFGHLDEMTLQYLADIMYM